MRAIVTARRRGAFDCQGTRTKSSPPSRPRPRQACRHVLETSLHSLAGPAICAASAEFERRVPIDSPVRRLAAWRQPVPGRGRCRRLRRQRGASEFRALPPHRLASLGTGRPGPRCLAASRRSLAFHRAIGTMNSLTRTGCSPPANGGEDATFIIAPGIEAHAVTAAPRSRIFKEPGRSPQARPRDRAFARPMRRRSRAA